jgi:Holliday junction resolvasome RuvABC DNA-binding subunit
MYESLRGRLTSKDSTSCVVEAGGLGYALHVPFSTAERLPAVGAEVAMKLHLVVREDEEVSVSRTRSALFRSCLSVSGVVCDGAALRPGCGPRTCATPSPRATSLRSRDQGHRQEDG